jgi:hypothetical protein
MLLHELVYGQTAFFPAAENFYGNVSCSTARFFHKKLICYMFLGGYAFSWPLGPLAPWPLGPLAF